MGSTRSPPSSRSGRRADPATLCGSHDGEPIMVRSRLTRRSAAILLGTMLLVPALADRAQAQSAIVRLVIDYGDGVTKTITALAWVKGSTVLDVMNAAKSRPHGISFSYSGSGGASLFPRIHDCGKQGAGKKNTPMWVKSRHSDKNVSAPELQPR